MAGVRGAPGVRHAPFPWPASAPVVLWRLRADIAAAWSTRPGRGAGGAVHRGAFFVLAGYVVVEGLCDLVTGAAPDTSRVGIALAGASIVIMPWLAWAKHRAGQAMGSRLILVDAAETRLCAWAVGVDVRGSGRRRRGSG